VSDDGRHIYIADIGPNIVWQFINYDNGTSGLHVVGTMACDRLLFSLCKTVINIGVGELV